MIEVNGIYKMKKIKNYNMDDGPDYKVLAMSKDKKYAVCEELDGFEKGKRFYFMTECIIDPEHPEDIYFGELIDKN